METRKLGINLKDKLLEFEGEELNLDDSLFDANLISQEKGTSTVELKYSRREGDFVEEESEDIFWFFYNLGREETIVSPCPPDEYGTIGLIGYFDPKIVR